MIISTVFFIGYIPFASGTFGSLAALGCVWLLKPDRLLLGIMAAAVFALGTATARCCRGHLWPGQRAHCY